RHVVAVAIKYRRYGVPVSELIAEGNFGVVHALGKFEPERGIRFVTYAAHWVRAYILDHVIKSWSMVGGGSGPLRSRLFFKLRRERVRAVNLMGEGEAADRMVAERVGVTPEELSKLVQRLEARDVSLDVKVLDDSPVRLVDLLPAPDDQERSLFEEQVGGSVKSAVALAVSELDPRERYIAEHRLMADPAEELSLAEIGRSLGVSRERARQLEARTKRKLKTRIPALGSAVVLEWIENSIEHAPAA
ncbi:MAG TPA: sigma-70 family RNA polymerase sigma factor, partial [Polyangiaceae bacterium]|nr:sigma-70 family RNA polymerase sigma factor [Polyangiaceae bacterium]